MYSAFPGVPDADTAILNVAEVAPRLHTAIVDTTALLPAPTVYTVVFVVADGADCPRILYVVAIYSSICNYIMHPLGEMHQDLYRRLLASLNHYKNKVFQCQNLPTFVLLQEQMEQKQDTL